MKSHKIYSAKCRCSLCGGPAIVESLLPIVEDDKVGVCCEKCMTKEDEWEDKRRKANEE